MQKTAEISGDRNRTEYHRYAGWQLLQIDDASDRPVQQFVWGTQYIDEAVCMDVDTDSDGNCTDFTGSPVGARRFFYCQDANWNVTALLEATTSGVTVRERYEYDPYGTVRIYKGETGTAGTAPEQRAVVGKSLKWLDANLPENPILYAGYVYDTETGLNHVRHRMYSAQLQRWMQRDPLGDLVSVLLKDAPSMQSSGPLEPIPTDAVTHGVRSAIVRTAHRLGPKITAANPQTLQYAAGSSLYQYLGKNPLIATDPSGLAEFMVTIVGTDYGTVAATINVHVTECCDTVRFIQFVRETWILWYCAWLGGCDGDSEWEIDQKGGEQPWYPHWSRQGDVYTMRDEPGGDPFTNALSYGFSQDFETCAVCLNKKMNDRAPACVLGCVTWGHAWSNKPRLHSWYGDTGGWVSGRAPSSSAWRLLQEWFGPHASLFARSCDE